MKNLSENSPVLTMHTPLTQGKVFLSGNIIPHVWYRKFCEKDGNPDLVAITILGDVVAWCRNGTSDNFGEQAPKFDGEALSMRYDYFEDRFGFNNQRVKRALIRLEEFGVLKRSIRNIRLQSGHNINRLFITLDHDFFESCFRDPELDIRAGGGGDSGTFSGSSEDSGGAEVNGVIDYFIASNRKESNHKQSDLMFNKTSFNKNRSTKSGSNFCKNSFVLEETSSNHEVLVAGQLESQSKSKICRTKFSKAKELKDFYPLSAEDCRYLQSASGREFSLNAMNEILLDMSKRVSDCSFYSKKGFLLYMSKAFTYEMRDAVKVSNVNFRIRNNQSQEEVTVRQQEQYLSEIENSLQVSPEWHLKKKLACVFETDKSYQLLRAYRSISREGGIFSLYLDKYVVLTDLDREVILSQVKATHEAIDFESEGLGFIEELKIIMPEQNIAANKNSTEQSLPTISPTIFPTGIWGDIRRQLTAIYGEAIDRNWFSKLEAKVDEAVKEIKLKAPSDFIKDWISQNYSCSIERVCGAENYRLGGVVV